MPPMWLGLCWRTRSFPACSIQIDSGNYKSCRGLSEDPQNNSDQTDLPSPNSAKNSPVRAVLEEVISILMLQLKELDKQLRSIVHAVMPALLDLSGFGAIVAGT